MNDIQSMAALVRFGAFEVNLVSHKLRKHGMHIRLEEKSFQILEMLLVDAGQVVTRKALRERLWPNTVVGYDHGLNTAVNKLRDLLGDSARSPRFVETLPRIGYRFIASVTPPDATAPLVPRSSHQPPIQAKPLGVKRNQISL
jgi:DNA-binding winged helix-turn-helix (wHTH) protein